MKIKNRFLSYFGVLIFTFISVFGLLFGASSLKGDSSKVLIDEVAANCEENQSNWFAYATEIKNSRESLIQKSTEINKKFYNYRERVLPIENNSVKYNKKYYSFSNIDFLSQEGLGDFNSTHLKIQNFDKKVFYETKKIDNKKRQTNTLLRRRYYP